MVTLFLKWDQKYIVWFKSYHNMKKKLRIYKYIYIYKYSKCIGITKLQFSFAYNLVCCEIIFLYILFYHKELPKSCLSIFLHKMGFQSNLSIFALFYIWRNRTAITLSVPYNKSRKSYYNPGLTRKDFSWEAEKSISIGSSCDLALERRGVGSPPLLLFPSNNESYWIL